MFESWLLNTLNFFFPTMAALLLLVSQHRLMRVIAAYGPGESRDALKRHHRRVTIAISLLAAWLIIQYLPNVV